MKGTPLTRRESSGSPNSTVDRDIEMMHLATKKLEGLKLENATTKHEKYIGDAKTRESSG